MKSPKIYFNGASLKPVKFKKQILNLTARIIDNGQFILGKQNIILERNLDKYFGFGQTLAVASGHDAIMLSLAALNLKPGDEVIFPVNSLCTAYPVYLSGVKPVPVDIDENAQINLKDLEKKITKNTKVIILVHLYGLVGNINKVKKLISGKHITIIEDCAQAFGAKYQNKLIGTIGDISCYSFYPTKNLGTVGDGGAVWTKHPQIFKTLKELRNYGEIKKYWSSRISGHSRLSEIQAGVLNLYLTNINIELKKRLELYVLYLSLINKYKLTEFIRPLVSDPHSIPAPHLFVVEAKNRNSLKKYLEKNKIPSMIHYPFGLWEITGFKSLNLKLSEFPIASRLTKNILSLPFHPYLTKSQIVYILTQIKNYYHES